MEERREVRIQDTNEKDEGCVYGFGRNEILVGKETGTMEKTRREI